MMPPLGSLGDNRSTAILAVMGHGQARPGSVRYRPTVWTSYRERVPYDPPRVSGPGRGCTCYAPRIGAPTLNRWLSPRPLGAGGVADATSELRWG